MIYSFEGFGYEGSLVNVEVDLRRGIPAVDIVGLGDCIVSLFREKIRDAIHNSGYEFPPERVLISLSPADLLKRDNGHELATALAVLAVQAVQAVQAVLAVAGKPAAGMSAAEAVPDIRPAVPQAFFREAGECQLRFR